MRIKVDWFNTYLSRVENSEGSNMWRNSWGRALDNPELGQIDFLENGKLSCGLHVSGILSNFSVYNFDKNQYDVIICPGMLVRASRLYEKLLFIGWEPVPIDEIEKGDILFWEELSGIEFVEKDGSKTVRGSGEIGHAGFYLGEQKAISVYYKTGNPQIHDYLYRGDDDFLKDKKYGAGKKQREILFALRGRHLFDKMP